MARARTRDTIPLYLLGLDDARRTDPLERVVRTGWRFLGASEGTSRLLRACELAREEIGAQDIVYEPRVIDVPALNFSALWLHGPAEPYVSLLERDDTLRLDRNLRARIRSAVEEWSRHASPADGPKPETPWNY